MSQTEILLSHVTNKTFATVSVFRLRSSDGNQTHKASLPFHGDRRMLTEKARLTAVCTHVPAGGLLEICAQVISLFQVLNHVETCLPVLASHFRDYPHLPALFQNRERLREKKKLALRGPKKI